MEYLTCAIIGYFLGCLSPAALFSRRKNIDLKKNGTGNLGATNTMLVMGKGYGAAVMVLDIAKAFAASKLAKMLFPHLVMAGLLAGLFAVLGHIFPFYLQFQGGKGLASFGGMVLAYNGWVFLALLGIGLVCMFVFDYAVALTMSAITLFPIIVIFQTRDLGMSLVAIVTTVVLFVRHLGNLERVRSGKDAKVSEFIRDRMKKTG